MKDLTRNLCAWFFLFLLTACQTQPREFHHSILSFGTIIDITLYDVDKALANKIFTDLEQDFKLRHNAWSPWVKGSLMRVNQLLPMQKKFSISPSIVPLIHQSIQLSAATEQLFNPAIGKLINLWAFHKYADPDIKPPDAERIKRLVSSNPRVSDVRLEGVQAQSTNTDVQLNFGAFAKGYAIDQSIKHLQASGVKHAIINTGGDLKAIGRHGDRPWRIGIRHPRKNSLIASIETHGEESIFTSGDYQRYYIYKGKRYHHILDPRTGYPAQGTQSVTVIHRDAGLADAAATALFIAGPKEWFNMARKLNLKQVMLIDSNGHIHLTPAMKSRLQFAEEDENTLIISSPL
jgi:thiamine biosynthesis lipoprotein